MKVLRISLGLLFASAAAVQYNDPDPLYWIVIYASVAMISVGRALGRYSPFWTAAVFGGILAGMLVALPGFLDYLASGNFGSLTGDMTEAPYIEPAREFLGLLFALGSLVGTVRFGLPPVKS